MQYSNPYLEAVIESTKSVFNIINEEEKKTLNDNHTYTSFKKNEIIYIDGEKPGGLICLAQGKVKVFRGGVGGREQIVRMVRPYGFIGYRALFAGENYIASAVALEDSVICVLDKDVLFKILRNNAKLTMRFLSSLATELGFSNRRTVNLTQKHIRGRLSESLLFLLDTYGFEQDGQTLKVYLSREDIANLSNMTTSNAIRTLSTFASENIISLEGRKIKILDLHKLERISELG